MTDGGRAETSNLAALPAIARLGACESAQGPTPNGTPSD